MSQRRLEILQQAASLDPRAFAGNRLVGERNFKEACKSDWNPWDGNNGVEVDDEESEIPVLDAITQMPLSKDDVVVLSDGKCYSKESMRSLLAQGVVGLFTGRANLPLSGQPMTDLDYALLDQDPPTLESSAEARARTSQVGMDALATQTTDEQRRYERLRRQGMTPEQISAMANRLPVSTVGRRENNYLRDYQDDNFVWPAQYQPLINVITGRDSSISLDNVLERDRNMLFDDDDITVNNDLLLRLSKLPNVNAQSISRVLLYLLGRPRPTFDIGVLTHLFRADDIANREEMLRQRWLFNARRLFELDPELKNLELYANQLSQLVQLPLETNSPHPMKDLIREIFRRGNIDQIHLIPEVIEAYWPEFNTEGDEGMDLDRLNQILYDQVLLEIRIALVQSDSKDFIDPIQNRDLDAMEEIASSGNVFNGTIDQNNKDLVLLSFLPMANHDSISHLLESLPGGRERFSMSVMADLFLREPDLVDISEFLVRRWLLLRPDLFQIDSDRESLKRYVRALADAELSSYEICEIRPDRLLDFVQIAYQRGQSFSYHARNVIISAYLQRIINRSPQCQFDLVAFLRAVINRQWDIFAEEQRRSQQEQQGAPSLQSEARQQRRDRSTRYNPL